MQGCELVAEAQFDTAAARLSPKQEQTLIKMPSYSAFAMRAKKLNRSPSSSSTMSLISKTPMYPVRVKNPSPGRTRT
jgi:hypothetical protein